MTNLRLAGFEAARGLVRAGRGVLVAAGLFAVTAAAVSGCGSGASRPRRAAPASRVARTTVRPAAVTMAMSAAVTPDRSGTPRRPRGVRISLEVVFNGAGARAAPLRQIEVAFPPGNVYGGARVPACSAAILGRAGPSGCPRGSVTGAGRIVATAGGVRVAAPITVLNGGAGRVLVYVELDHPVRVAAVAVGSVQTLSGSSAYELRFTIPPELRSLAGVPVVLERMQLSAGRGDWLATVDCPAARAWRYTANAQFADGRSASQQFTVGCR